MWFRATLWFLCVIDRSYISRRCVPSRSPQPQMNSWAVLSHWDETHKVALNLNRKVELYCAPQQLLRPNQALLALKRIELLRAPCRLSFLWQACRYWWSCTPLNNSVTIQKTAHMAKVRVLGDQNRVRHGAHHSRAKRETLACSTFTLPSSS